MQSCTSHRVSQGTGALSIKENAEILYCTMSSAGHRNYDHREQSAEADPCSETVRCLRMGLPVLQPCFHFARGKDFFY